MIALLLAVMSVIWAKPQEAEGVLNRLLAPGPLMMAHQNLEGSQCLKCHEAGKGISEEKCLACHKEIREKVLSKKGFHGVATDSCITCHGDHKGREKDTTDLDETAFKHERTDFPLDGKHAGLKCAQCHTQLRKDKASRKIDTHFFGLSTTCVSCHKRDDVHHFTGRLQTTDCNQCHGTRGWKLGLQFDHARDGNFKLDGKHAELKCAECHKAGKYSWPGLKTKECRTCHEDFHKQNLSPKFQTGKCQQCHAQTTWKIEPFNHAATGYPLRGKHSDLKCAECHKQENKEKEMKHFTWKGLKSDCLSCHKDFHRFGHHQSKKLGNLEKCLDCHTEHSWKETHSFNHSVDTRFPVDGKHVGLNCTDCHLPGSKKSGVQSGANGQYFWSILEKDNCAGCHKTPHTEPSFQAKRCNECHSTQGWQVFQKDGKKFDHDTTRFQLKGRHTAIACSACHVLGKKEIFKFPHEAKGFCVDCHKSPHKGQFDPKIADKACADCHNQTHFSDRVKFDHAESGFPLKGGHEKVKCSECHKSTEEVFEGRTPHAKSKFLFPEMKDKDCATCHKDFHGGQLDTIKGPVCSSCHTDISWKRVIFDHNKQSRFAITGKHMGVKCSECHKTIAGPQHVLFKPISTECTTCHKDPHQGHFGVGCQECHMDQGWKLTKDFHKNFSLSGVHFSLQCQECHKDNRRLSGMSLQCQFCHQKDDTHQGTLPQCGECHKQQFWENTDFKHSLSRFPLRGAHRGLECAACHGNGVYQGTSTDCKSCHLSDAFTSSFHPNPIPSFTDCKSCHNQFAF
ncbi:MAG: hypothetical protein HYR96_08545 [Deltaproteobacteria bacterium]|nr:hypothetical protein [Deltaproteobacteria bacterium]MBI3294660.1 hypothetical protein [Deltaproteobacteria bacterium]